MNTIREYDQSYLSVMNTEQNCRWTMYTVRIYVFNEQVEKIVVNEYTYFVNI